ncbi:hypothetical protein AB0F64_04360 [Streptomyces sp. NPDC026294]|uniref:hypothetical protein n=1 Tax=Streptomyces sp. NPDC026294 TaxID=3155362 RepID=UPI0033C51F98
MNVTNSVTGGTVGHLVQTGVTVGGRSLNSLSFDNAGKWDRHAEALEAIDPSSVVISRTELRAIRDLIEEVANQDDGPAGQLADTLLERLITRGRPRVQ